MKVPQNQQRILLRRGENGFTPYSNSSFGNQQQISLRDQVALGQRADQLYDSVNTKIETLKAGDDREGFDLADTAGRVVSLTKEESPNDVVWANPLKPVKSNSSSELVLDEETGDVLSFEEHREASTTIHGQERSWTTDFPPSLNCSLEHRISAHTGVLTVMESVATVKANQPNGDEIIKDALYQLDSDTWEFSHSVSGGLERIPPKTERHATAYYLNDKPETFKSKLKSAVKFWD